MPFRLFALNGWQLTSFVIFLGWPSSVGKPESKRYCVASNLFLFKEYPKGDSFEAVFQTCCKVEATSFVGLTCITRSVPSPSFVI